MNVGVIYGLKDPRTPWRIRYVGSTLYIKRRLKAHRRGCEGSKTLNAWFRVLKKANVQPELEVLEYVSEEQIPCREQAWIDLMNSFFPLLNNLAMGRTTSRKRRLHSELTDISVNTETTV